MSGAIAVAGCLGALACGPPPAPSLTLEQHSYRLALEAGADGVTTLAGEGGVLGRIDLGPILEAEVEAGRTTQLLIHFGRYYVVGEGFRNLWEMVPVPGTDRATYRPILLPEGPARGVRLSRYGGGGGCVRLDFESAAPRFLDRGGTMREHCR